VDTFLTRRIRGCTAIFGIDVKLSEKKVDAFCSQVDG
jgi:hypothetical protein